MHLGPLYSLVPVSYSPLHGLSILINESKDLPTILCYDFIFSANSDIRISFFLFIYFFIFLFINDSLTNHFQSLCRSEIDRLTALLHSKTIDTSIENGEKSSEAIPLKSFMSHHNQDAFPKMHARANGIETHLVSTPAVGSSV